MASNTSYPKHSKVTDPMLTGLNHLTLAVGNDLMQACSLSVIDTSSRKTCDRLATTRPRLNKDFP